MQAPDQAHLLDKHQHLVDEGTSMTARWQSLVSVHRSKMFLFTSTVAAREQERCEIICLILICSNNVTTRGHHNALDPPESFPSRINLNDGWAGHDR